VMELQDLTPFQGINNRIKVIKRMAYGFRDEACFFLESEPPFPECVINQEVG
ncbi:MAG: transposase, partial [Thiohalospira sp.]